MGKTADNPMFCLADICRVLELRTSDVKERLKTPGVDSIGVGVRTGVKKDGYNRIGVIDSLGRPQDVKKRLDEKGVDSINTLTNGGEQMMLFVNEKNLYKVIMRSDKP